MSTSQPVNLTVHNSAPTSLPRDPSPPPTTISEPLLSTTAHNPSPPPTTNPSPQIIHTTILTTSTDALLDFLDAQISPVPTLILHIRSRAFRLAFDVSSLLDRTSPGTVAIVPPSVACYRGTRRRSPAAEDPQDHYDLRDWCADFTSSKWQWCKSFSIQRRVVGLDDAALLTVLLDQAIREKTHYSRSIDVWFEVTPSLSVVVPDNPICRLGYEHNGFKRWASWALIAPLMWLRTKKWAVVEIKYKVRAGAEGEWGKRWAGVVAEMAKRAEPEKKIAGALTVARLSERGGAAGNAPTLGSLHDKKSR